MRRKDTSGAGYRAWRGNHETCIGDWAEWLDRCSLDLCSKSTQEAIGALCQKRLRGNIGQWLQKFCLDGVPGDLWEHLEEPVRCGFEMEHHFKHGKVREGKSYKEGLKLKIAKAGCRALPAAEGYVSQTIKTTVAQKLVERFATQLPGTISLDDAGAPSAGGESGGARRPLDALIEEARNLLADHEADSPDGDRDIGVLGGAMARVLFDAMDTRRRLAAWGAMAGRSVADPEIIRAAGVGRDAIHLARRALGQEIAQMIERDFTHESPDAVALLKASICSALVPLLDEWKNSDTGVTGNST